MMKTRFSLLVSLCLVIVGGCRTTISPEMASMKYPVDVVPIYFLLGALDEYKGRRIAELGDDTVECFYSSEKKESEVFRAYLSRLMTEEKINTTIQTEVGPGGHIFFVSPELRHRINVMYDYSFKRGWGEEGAIDEQRNMLIRDTQAYVSASLFDRTDGKGRLSYLAGAYMRYGKDNTFHFANACHKVGLIMDVLKQFGCRQVKLRLSPPEEIPTGSTITFESTDILKQMFSAIVAEKKRVEEQTKAKDSL